MTGIVNCSRREFLKLTAALGGGLALGLSAADGKVVHAAARSSSVSFNAWLHIGDDGTVTVIHGQAEIGQGTSTGLAMALADELDADWSKVRIAFDTFKTEYIHPIIYKDEQITGGSLSVVAFFMPMRRAGAAAREMLVAAAAKDWKVAPTSCSTEQGTVVHVASGRRKTYGELASRAAQMPVPREPVLKEAKDLRLIGRPLPRLDTRDSVMGKTIYGIDIIVPNMLHAAVRHAPRLGSSIEKWDGATAWKMAGVRAIVPLGEAIAVVADHYWQAAKALQAVEITFSATPFDQSDSADVREQLQAGLGKSECAVVRSEGAAERLLQTGQKVLEAEYYAPFQAHATMEPMNCTASVTSRGCEIWVSTQSPTSDRNAAAKILGLPIAKIQVHMLRSGGGFGRRWSADYTAEAVQLSAAVKRPVKVIWSREEDIRADWYRPAFMGRFRAVLDKNGLPEAWVSRVAGAGVWAFTRPELVKNDTDLLGYEGTNDLLYRLPHQRIEYALVKAPIRVGFWRSVGYSHNTFFVESFVDELAHAAERDPYQYRRDLLAHDSRSVAVLDLAAKKSGWGTPLSSGQYRGIAFLHSPRWQVRMAQVAEVSIRDNRIEVHRIVCATDSGMLINPALAEAQMMGGIVFGLSQTLSGEITLKHGAVVQSNFHDFSVLRFNQTPIIEAYFIEGASTPGSIGETAVPVVAPAVANAVFAASGKRIRSLPLENYVAN